MIMRRSCGMCLNLEIVTDFVSQVWSLVEQIRASETPVFLLNHSELGTQ